MSPPENDIKISISFIPINGNANPPNPYINMFIPSNFVTDDDERYLTPLSANGISNGIIMALNITAARQHS